MAEPETPASNSKGEEWGCFVLCLAVALMIAAPAIIKIIETLK